MIGRGFDFERDDAAGGLDFLEQGVVIFEEEIEELRLMAPLALVVILHGVGLVCTALGWSALGQKRSGERSGKNHGEKGEENSAHEASLKRLPQLYLGGDSRYSFRPWIGGGS